MSEKGFVSAAMLLLAGFTLLLGLGASAAIKDAKLDGCHNVTLFLRDINSGLLWMEIEEHKNSTEHLTYREMPESMTFRTDADVVYLRDDGSIITGLLTNKELKSWMGCRDV